MTTTLTDYEYETIRKCAVEGRKYRGWVEVEVGELLDNDIEGFNDLLSAGLLGGSTLLEDIGYSLVDFKRPGSDILIFEVYGNVGAFFDEVEGNR